MGSELYEGYDRVSAILDVYQAPQLIDWKIRVGKREAGVISRKATSVGTNVDDYIRAEIEGSKLPKLKTVEAENCVRAWEKFKEDYQIDPSSLQSATRLFDEETRVCGEPDLLRPSITEVLDLKCSSSIRESYWIQTNWYCYQLGYTHRSILRLDKNLGIYEYERRAFSEKDLSVFKALTEVYRYFNKGQSPDNQGEK